MAEAKPVVTFDMDGVLCRQPLGINPGGLKDDAGANPRRGGLAAWLLWKTERWRYAFRKPMPGALEGFRQVGEFADCIVLTARGEAARPGAERWFRRHFGEVPRLEMRGDGRESSRHFKQRRVAELGAAAHLEDDPNTARLLAASTRVYLVDWHRNRGFEHNNIVRVAGVGEAVEHLRTYLEPTNIR